MQTQKIRDKYNKDKGFRQQMDKAEKAYNQSLTMAIYSDLSIVPKETMRSICKDSDMEWVYIYYGMLQPDDKMEKVYYYLISQLEEQQFTTKLTHDKYTFIFVNTLCSQKNSYSNFKAGFKKLPLKYFEKLKRFIILQPTFSIRNGDYLLFGTIAKHLKSKTVFINKFQQLKQFGIEVDKKFISHLLPDIRKIFYPNENQPVEDVSNVSLVNKRGHFKHKQTVQIDLNDIIERKIGRTDLALHEFERSEIGVPTLLKYLVMYLKSNENYLKQQGLFRKSISIDDQKIAITKVYSGEYDYLDTITNPHIVANLIKKFLTNLKVPLFNYEWHQLIIQHKIDNQEAQIEIVKGIVKALHEVNYNTLLFLLEFFVHDVCPHQNDNKMPLSNVAKVLAPCLIRSKVVSLADIANSEKLIRFVEILLVNFQQIFGNKKQIRIRYRDSVRKSQQSELVHKINQESKEIDIIKQLQQQHEIATKNNKEVQKPVPKSQIYTNSSSSFELLQNEQEQFQIVNLQKKIQIE